MDKGTLIIVNGGSSAGKTSLAKAFQDLMLPKTWLLLGIDIFWLSLPPRELDLERVERAYYSWDVHNEGGKEYFRITPGPLLDRTMFGRYRAIAQFLELGMNVIADDVIWKREWLLDALRVFEPYRVFFVGVFVSDDEGARRETARGDRHPGWDRGSARFAHHDAIYDLRIDTTFESPAQAAADLRRALESGLNPGAFAEMRRKFL
jgi:chloramphenicol 3-O phosphotransferase